MIRIVDLFGQIDLITGGGINRDLRPPHDQKMRGAVERGKEGIVSILIRPGYLPQAAKEWI